MIRLALHAAAAEVEITHLIVAPATGWQIASTGQLHATWRSPGRRCIHAPAGANWSSSQQQPRRSCRGQKGQMMISTATNLDQTKASMLRRMAPTQTTMDDRKMQEQLSTFLN